MKREFATFTGQTKSHLVRGRLHYKIKNTCYHTTEHPISEEQVEMMFGKVERNELEQAYYEFCKKVHHVVTGSFGGDIYAKQVIIPDFKFDVITNNDDFTIK